MHTVAPGPKTKAPSGNNDSAIDDDDVGLLCFGPDYDKQEIASALKNDEKKIHTLREHHQQVQRIITDFRKTL